MYELSDIGQGLATILKKRFILSKIYKDSNIKTILD